MLFVNCYGGCRLRDLVRFDLKFLDLVFYYYSFLWIFYLRFFFYRVNECEVKFNVWIEYQEFGFFLIFLKQESLECFYLRECFK